MNESNMNSDKSYMAVGVIVALIVGAIIGGLFGRASAPKYQPDGNDAAMMAEKNKTGDVMVKTSSKAADLRVALNNLFEEHVNLASAATRAGFDGQPQFAESAKALDANSVAISEAIGSVYGSDAQARFLEIWRSHIGFFVDYTVAAKKGDKAGMDKAVQNLNGYVEAISDFLSKANPNLPKEAVKSNVSEHVLQLKGIVDAYGAGDYAKSYSMQREAAKHMGMVGDIISGAIIKQFPDKF